MHNALHNSISLLEHTHQSHEPYNSQPAEELHFTSSKKSIRTIHFATRVFIHHLPCHSDTHHSTRTYRSPAMRITSRPLTMRRTSHSPNRFSDPITNDIRSPQIHSEKPLSPTLTLSVKPIQLIPTRQIDQTLRKYYDEGMPRPPRNHTKQNINTPHPIRKYLRHVLTTNTPQNPKGRTTKHQILRPHNERHPLDSISPWETTVTDTHPSSQTNSTHRNHTD